MTDLYSIRDVARIFGLQESRLRYWMQTGFVGPTVRRGGRFFYTFQDLIGVKAAKDLLDAGLPVQRVRKNLEALRAVLPDDASPVTRLRICSDGETLVAIQDDITFEPQSGQIVMAFALSSLSSQVAEILALPLRDRKPPIADTVNGADDADADREDGAPEDVDDEPTDHHGLPSGYRAFLDGCSAEDRGDLAGAEACYRAALELEGSLAAVHTNLGNLLYRRGDLAGARAYYEQAIELEPGQPEARYNLANLLEDVGETDLAIAELRRVCVSAPDFADAHYNLGLILARVGGHAQAQRHLERYLEIDAASPWAEHARGFLSQISA